MIKNVQMQLCGKTGSYNEHMSQACEINNNKELTVLHLQIVSQKECETIKWGLFLATKLYFQCKENLLGTKVGYFKFKIQLSTRKHKKNFTS